MLENFLLKRCWLGFYDKRMLKLTDILEVIGFALFGLPLLSRQQAPNVSWRYT